MSNIVDRLPKILSAGTLLAGSMLLAAAGSYANTPTDSIIGSADGMSTNFFCTVNDPCDDAKDCTNCACNDSLGCRS